MDGAASPPATEEEDSSGSGAVDLDPRRPASPPMMGEGQKEEEQGYLDLFLRVSLQLLQKGHGPHVRHQGLKLMLHLLRFRWDQLHVEEWSARRHCLFVASGPGVAASAVNRASVTNSIEKGDDGFFVSDDLCNNIMDISFQRILKKSAAMSPESLELLSDELYGNNDIIQYRFMLLDLIRFIAYERPIIAARRTVQRISYIIGDASALSKYPKNLAANEVALLVLQMVVNTIFEDSAKIILDTKFPLQGLYKIFAGLLVKLLSLKWTEARLMFILQRYLSVLCPFLKHFPDAIAMVLTRLLELSSSVKDDCHDPSKAQYARMQICRCIFHIYQAVDGPSLPFDMKDLFSVPHIAEEAVLVFVASKGSSYSVENKQVGREGNQDGENADCTLSRKELDHNLNPYPQLYHTSFPLHGSVPISWLRLGTKSQHRNEGKSLNLNPEYHTTTESCSTTSLACSGSPCLARVKQRQWLHVDGELQTHVSSLMQVAESQLLNIFDDCSQVNDQEENTVHGDFEGSSESVDEGKLANIYNPPPPTVLISFIFYMLLGLRFF